MTHHDDAPHHDDAHAATHAATPKAAPTPGWSNAPPHDGITSTEPPPPVRNYSTPGWSNTPIPAAPAATGATAGIPGKWTPTGAAPCPLFTQMNTIVASPATAWTTGQYVDLGDGSEAHWGGTNWTSGRA